MRRAPVAARGFFVEDQQAGAGGSVPLEPGLGSIDPHGALPPALQRLAMAQGVAVDSLELESAVREAKRGRSGRTPRSLLLKVFQTMQLPAPQFLQAVDPSMTPLLGFSQRHGWCVVLGKNGAGRWTVQFQDALQGSLVEAELDSLKEMVCVARVRMARAPGFGRSKVFAMVRGEFTRHRTRLLEVAFATVLVNVLALAASFYSMQVYDRVIPSQAINTLLVLTVGVVLANFFEFMVKLARTQLLDDVSVHVDRTMVRTIFLRLLSVRLDQFPTSVGSLSSELRGYESVKNFMSTTTLFMMVDAPFGLLFIVLMGVIGGIYMAMIPLVFLAISLGLSLLQIRNFFALAAKATAATNRKTGLLVETIEAAETIKAGAGGWRMLMRWVTTNDEARVHEMKMKHSSEFSQYCLAFAQQMAYVSLIAFGAYEVTEGAYTMGALIASSILAGRALAPVGAIPSVLMQWAQAKASLQGLDRLWALHDDHHDVDRPLIPETIRGDFQLEDVKVTYPGTPVALSIPSLTIRSGEKVGVVGPIGAGKTTLLRALSGMYKPHSGRVLIDGLDIAHVSKPLLSEYRAYLQQDGRLISGTLRDNLLIGGMADPGDGPILAAASKTGLLQLIQAHPKGLALPIAEGGLGLSGGQRQLVNLTRMVLREPLIWLLDEPTASMDKTSENHCMKMFQEMLDARHTLVLVTHKPEMLQLVDRLIVIANHQVVLDGEKNAVLAALHRAEHPTSEPASGVAGIAQEAPRG